MSPAATARCSPLCIALLCLYLRSASSLSFSLDFSKTGDPCGRELVCKGDASFGSAMIELTNSDPTSVASMMSQGRVWYGTPVPLWNAITGEVASFTTTFSFDITWMEGSPDWGDGMALFLSRFSRDGVLDSNYGGGLLGLFNNANHLDATGDSQVVAVEFDTLRNNEWDSSSQHVGIDVNSIKSVNYTNTSSPPAEMAGNAKNKNLTSGFTMTATVHYDNGTKLLAAHLQINDTLYHVSAIVDLKKILPGEMAIGFSAGTAAKKELHRVLSWSFNSTLEEKAALSPTGTQPAAQAPAEAAISSKPSSTEPLVFIRLLVPVASVSLVIAIVVGALVWLRRRRARETVEANSSATAAELEMGIIGPRRYTYRDLAAATNNFAERNKLGEGGFGSVYKGRLMNNDADNGQLLVAIKRFSSGSSASQSQGRKEFEAEVRIISRLRHRNLVQLLGWSDSRKGLLLVYELVPQGSLDEHIHNRNKLLTWSERYDDHFSGLTTLLRPTRTHLVF